MKRSETKREGESASALISQRIAELADWRGETLARIRALIHEADPDILVRRAIDIHEGEKIGARALKALVREAVALNMSGKQAAPRKRGRR